MPEVLAAVIGAGATMILMAVSNVSNRRERDMREIFARLNKIEQQIAAITQPRERRKDWRQ
tara:strand:+ start:678 stop:860 length:183 start_codon:yes stop_codon:yes gene_type:complete